MRTKNVSRPHKPENSSSVGETDDGFIQVEVEKTLKPGHAKHTVATEETNIEEGTLQNVQNEIPNVGTSEDLGRSVSRAAGEEKFKCFGKFNAGAEKPVLKKSTSSYHRLEKKIRVCARYRNDLPTISCILTMILTVITMMFLVQEATVK